MNIEKNDKILVYCFLIYADTTKVDKQVTLHTTMAIIFSLISIIIAKIYFSVENGFQLLLPILLTQFYWLVMVKINEKYCVLTWYILRKLSSKKFSFQNIKKDEVLFFCEDLISIKRDISNMKKEIKKINKELADISMETKNWGLRIATLEKKESYYKKIRLLKDKQDKIIAKIKLISKS